MATTLLSPSCSGTSQPSSNNSFEADGCAATQLQRQVIGDMARNSLTILFSLYITGCASIPPPQTLSGQQVAGPQTTAECSAKAGVWAKFSTYLPQISGDNDSYVCNTPTNDFGKPCTDPKNCQGTCLAPAHPAVAKEAVGSCSAYVLVPYNTWQVGHGFEFNPNVIP